MSTTNDIDRNVCHLCGKDSFQASGWLEKNNEKFGKWECRPSCDSKLIKEDRILNAIKRVFSKENI